MEAYMNAPAEKLVVDFKTLIVDTEDLLKATAANAGEKAADARVKAQQALANARAALARAEVVTTERAKAGAQVVDQSVRENPWAAVGIATGIGLLVGWMLSRH
jgi:ElaB/YqjD/DUF883 family membrane-anchored ribosome-binding protein